MISRRILVVDDEPYVLSALRRALHRSGFWVVTATSGGEGLELQRTALADGDPFAVIVADLLMPGMDGIDFLIASWAIDPTAARLLLSGHPDLPGFDRAKAARIHRILTKPCPPHDLVQILDQALRAKAST